MSGFTPGPWRVGNLDGGAPVVVADGRRIARVLYEIGSEDPEVHRNAEAIAAVPDLIAACELALPVLRDQHAALAPVMHGGVCPDREAMFAIEAALEKARGNRA